MKDLLESLAVARQLFISDTDEDVRDLAFLVVHSILGNAQTASDLQWANIRTERKAIVFEKHHTDFTQTPLKEWKEETECIELTAEALTLLSKLSDRIQDFANINGLEFPRFVFPMLSNRNFYIFEYGYSPTKRMMRVISVSDYKHIRTRISNHIMQEASAKREVKIANDPKAEQLKLKVDKIKKQLHSAEKKLEHYLTTGEILRAKRNGETVLSKQYGVPIETLDLETRCFNALKRAGITSVGDVQDMLMRGSDSLLAVRDIGEKALDGLILAMQSKRFLE